MRITFSPEEFEIFNDFVENGIDELAAIIHIVQTEGLDYDVDNEGDFEEEELGEETEITEGEEIEPPETVDEQIEQEE